MMARRSRTVLALVVLAALSLTTVFLYTERLVGVTASPALNDGVSMDGEILIQQVIGNNGSEKQIEGRTLENGTKGTNQLEMINGMKTDTENQENGIQKTDSAAVEVNNSGSGIDPVKNLEASKRQELEDNQINNGVSKLATGFKNNIGIILLRDDRNRSIKERLIQAEFYVGLASARRNLRFIRELRMRIRDIQRALGDARKDAELPLTATGKLKALEETLARGHRILDHQIISKKLLAMIQSREEQLKAHKKQTLFLTQVAAKTIPKSLNCLSLRLSIDYFSLNHSKLEFHNKYKLEDPKLYHYAIFSDNVLATAVVVNSTVVNAKDCAKHVFHIVTDRLNYAAFRMWFLAYPSRNATIQVQSIEDFTWLNSSYSPVLKQLGSPSMVNYYFRTRRAHPDHNLKFRNPKYLSILNHLRFYLPQILPKLEKVLFLDDDVVVQKDLTSLWRLNFKGNVNGAVETCGEIFHRYNRYLNFSNPIIAKSFDPHACGWAFGMNMFDLTEWRKQNITQVYHHWQNLNRDRLLWKLGSLPPGLITFWNRTFFLDRSWHVLGLGYNPDISPKEIERAAVIHYNGNLKPWLEIGIPKYHGYWATFLDYDRAYLRDCNINP